MRGLIANNTLNFPLFMNKERNVRQEYTYPAKHILHAYLSCALKKSSITLAVNTIMLPAN